MELPKIRVLWKRGRSARLDFKRPKTTLVLGGRGKGKSSLLETISTRYDGLVDFFGSRDNEGLAWCRSPFHSANEILFVTGNSVEVNGKWDALKIRDVKLTDLMKYRVVTSVSAFYSSMDEEFQSLNDLIIKVLYRRTSWRTQRFLKIREASNFLYSRVRITKNQVIAKNDFMYLNREGRHMGYPVGVDTIRWTSIDKEIRDTSDYMFIKSVGILGLPRDLRFLYRYVEPYSLMDPDPSVFVVVTRDGAIGLGNFDYPTWHKTEKEDMLEIFGLRPEYGEIPITGDEDARNIVGDFDHHDIVDKRLRGVFGEGRKRSMRHIAVAVRRSIHTIWTHLREYHDKQVKRRGYCERCRRIKSPHDRTITN